MSDVSLDIFSGRADGVPTLTKATHSRSVNSKKEIYFCAVLGEKRNSNSRACGPMRSSHF